MLLLFLKIFVSFIWCMCVSHIDVYSRSKYTLISRAFSSNCFSVKRTKKTHSIDLYFFSLLNIDLHFNQKKLTLLAFLFPFILQSEYDFVLNKYLSSLDLIKFLSKRPEKIALIAARQIILNLLQKP